MNCPSSSFSVQLGGGVLQVTSDPNRMLNDGAFHRLTILRYAPGINFGKGICTRWDRGEGAFLLFLGELWVIGTLRPRDKPVFTTLDM